MLTFWGIKKQTRVGNGESHLHKTWVAVSRETGVGCANTFPSMNRVKAALINTFILTMSQMTVVKGVAHGDEPT